MGTATSFLYYSWKRILQGYLVYVEKIIVDKHICMDWFEHFALRPLFHCGKSRLTSGDPTNSKYYPLEFRQWGQKSWSAPTFEWLPQHPRGNWSANTDFMSRRANINIIFGLQRLQRFLRSRNNRDLLSISTSTPTPSKNIGLLKNAWTISLVYINYPNKSDFLISTSPHFPVLVTLEIVHREVCIFQTVVKTEDGCIKHPQALYRSLRCI